ncbi:hypothetical protein FB451DRAFT_1552517 [Mycena latifolia]|nr:hypothetical protein FB451DRAFT_1552517 [Mycena latifolia]
MSDNSLPDEIISEILSPALKVPEEVFSDTSRVSPFAQYSESSSAYLLVSKSWLRVATPLLYNVVILRSKAQAKALGQALTKNEELGQFIKKLRAEGAYGKPMGTILQSSPNISDLFLSFEIYAADNTNGLCTGLPFINPTRIILRDVEYKPLDNKMTLNLEDTLTKAISKWGRLSIVDLPYMGWGRPARADKFAQALAKSRRLHTVVIPLDGVAWAYSALKTCPLQSIQIKKAVHKAHLEHLHLDENPELKALLKYTEKLPAANALAKYSQPAGGFDITPSLNPSFIPMNPASEELADDPATTELPQRLPFLLVSKMFHRLALPHLYTHIRLHSPVHISQVSYVLQNNPSLGAVVHTIYGDIVTLDDFSDSELDDLSADSDSGGNTADDDPALTLLSQITALVRFRGPSLIDDSDISSFLLNSESPISWAAFEAIVRCSGSTLREFSKRIAAHQRVSPAVFGNLAQLQILEWKCDTSFDFNLGIPNDAFSNLEELRIWSADLSFLTALSRMKLPALRRLFLSADIILVTEFLQAHGRKLMELQIRPRTVETITANLFELCPNLNRVTILFSYSDTPPVPDIFSSPQTARCSVQKIRFSLRIWSGDKGDVAKWGAFFTGFEPTHLPNLHEIEFPCFEWPTSERNIAKSYWVRWAENLLKHNINLTDRNGMKWRPRLKVR